MHCRGELLPKANHRTCFGVNIYIWNSGRSGKFFFSVVNYFFTGIVSRPLGRLCCATPSAAPVAPFRSRTPRTRSVMTTRARRRSAATCSAIPSAAPAVPFRSLTPKPRCVITTRARLLSAATCSAARSAAPAAPFQSLTPKPRCAPTLGAPTTSAAFKGEQYAQFAMYAFVEPVAQVRFRHVHVLQATWRNSYPDRYVPFGRIANSGRPQA